MKLGNIKMIPKPRRIIAYCPVSPPKKNENPVNTSKIFLKKRN